MCLGIPGQIVASCDDGDSPMRMAKVRFGGITKDVSLAFTPEAEVGQYVIVHVGFAISVLDETEANRVLDALDKIGAQP